MKKYLYRTFLCIFAVAFSVAQNIVLAQVTTNEAVSVKFLDNKSVSIIKTRYINIEGVSHKFGESLTVLFENSAQGRESLAQNISEPFLSAVMTVWGDTPTIISQEGSSTLLSKESGTAKLTSESETVTVNEEMHIDFLDNNSVAFLKIKSTNINGVEYQLDESWAVSYENSERGRESLAENISDPFLSAVMAVWGDTPTVTLPTESQSV